MSERAPPINVTELIDLRPLTELQIRVTLLCALTIFLDGIDVIVIGLVAPSLAAAIGVGVTSFGPVFGIGQAGILVGVLTFGPLGDRFGRKRLVIGSILLFATFTLLTIWTTSFNELLLVRFFTGLGLGGAAPNAVALTSEFAPKRLRAAFVSAQWAALPLGGVAVGLLSSVLIMQWGWQSLFYIGSIVPLVLAAALILILPESVSFLLARGLDTGGVRKTVARLAPDLPADPDTRYVVNTEKLPGAPMKHLFTEGRAPMTLLLWVPFFTSFMILIFITSWIPTLLRANGLSVAQAGFAIALNSFGSFIGSASVGRLMDRFGAYNVLIPTFVLASIAAGLLGFSLTNLGSAALAVITLSGFFAGASQAGVIALAAVVYPVAIRSTGVGWAMAIGRFGAVVGPILGGLLLGWQWRADQILLVIAVPELIGALCVFLVGKLPAARPAL
jgi:MFS transporter, AAHS family, 4-hydroxybenzoate transporter